MTTHTSLLSRRMALGAIAGSALLTTLPALAEGRLTDVRVIDRDRDTVLPVYRFRGEFWVAGEPGARSVSVKQRITARSARIFMVAFGVGFPTHHTPHSMLARQKVAKPTD